MTTVPKNKTQFVTPQALADLVRSAVLTGKANFSVINIKKDGTQRKWIINPRGGRSTIKGTGKVTHLAANLLKVHDVTASQGRNARGQFGPAIANGWRTLNIDTILEAKISGETYRTWPQVFI